MKRLFFTLIFFYALFVGATAQVTDGLVYDFRFNRNTRDVATITEFTGNRTWTTDRNGNENSAVYINSPSSGSLNATLANYPYQGNPVTVSFWFKLNSAGNDTFIFSSGAQTNSSAFGVIYKYLSGWKFLFYGWSDDMTVNIPDGLTEPWNHIVATLDADKMARLYLNGVLVGESLRTNWSCANQNVTLGKQLFEGAMDDLKIYNRAVTAEEAAELFTEPTIPYENTPRLVAHFDFENTLTSSDALHSFSNQVESGAAPVAFTSEGKSGMGVNFTAVNALVNNTLQQVIPADGYQAHSISFWAKPRTAGNTTYNTMVELFGSEYLRFTNNTKTEVGFSNNGSNWIYSENNSFSPVDEWAHYVLVYLYDANTNNTFVKVYKNGVQLTFGGASSAIAVHRFNNTFVFGGGSSSPTVTYFNGILDELSVYNYKLSDTEILNLATQFSEAPVPVISVQATSSGGTNTTLCEGGWLYLHHNSSTGTVVERLWDFGDGETSTAAVGFHYYNTPGTYSVSLTVSNGGGSNTLTLTDYITVTPKPISAFTVDLSNSPTVSFTNNSQYADSYVIWYFGSAGYSYDFEPTYTFTENGAYVIQLTAANACGYTDSFETITISNVATETIAANKTQIYPNPASDMLNIVSETELSNVEITNIFGQTVLSSTEKNISVKNLNSGLYIVKTLDIDGNVSTQKFVKE